jgi:O-antigen/teichoic acid export membrane protein
MLRRIFVIGVLTGTGQLYSIFVLKFLSQHSSSKGLNQIAQLDSLLIFVMNVLAFGLQSAAIRDLALSPNWKKEYSSTQSARMAMGVMLMFGAVLAIVRQDYFIFLLAPILAWSGDYALYARGAPVVGAFISFLRQAIPFTFVLIAGFLSPGYLGLTYGVSILVIYVLTNLLINSYLKVGVVYKPRFKSLRLYIQSLELGVVAISLYFLGLGLILIAPYFYPATVVSTAFVGLKFYILFKGVLRMIHQAFVKEMTDERMCLKVDQLSIVVAFLLVGSALIFPASFISLFFGSKYVKEKDFFILLSLSAMIYSFFLSMATRSMLQKKDKKYSQITLIAALVTIFALILLSYFLRTATSIGISLIAGELTWMIGLVNIAASTREVKQRTLFAVMNFLPLVIPFSVWYFFGDTLVSYISGITLFGAILLLLHHEKFKA